MHGNHWQAQLKLLIPVLLFKVLVAGAAEESQAVHAPGIELPEGEGRVLLLAACTRCHDLRGLPAYKGYWNQQRWLEMVQSMIKNSAPLTEEQANVLAEYLAEHFGRPTPNAPESR